MREQVASTTIRRNLPFFRRNRRWFYGSVLACGAVVCAQQNVEFDAASVKTASPGLRMVRCAGGPGTSDPSTFTCINYSLSYLVMMAYDLRAYQLKAPEWMDTARLEVVAKIRPGATVHDFQIMQQKLLADRFNLKAHFEDVEMNGYELVAPNGAAKLKRSSEAQHENPDLLWRPPVGGPSVRAMAHVSRKNQSMGDLAGFLADQLRQPVVDETGLDGRYDYEFSFLMEPGGRAAGPVVADGTGPEFGASLIDAIREGLGLRLQKKKGRAKVLIIDHADKSPAEN